MCKSLVLFFLQTLDFFLFSFFLFLFLVNVSCYPGIWILSQCKNACFKKSIRMHSYLIWLNLFFIMVQFTFSEINLFSVFTNTCSLSCYYYPVQSLFTLYSNPLTTTNLFSSPIALPFSRKSHGFRNNTQCRLLILASLT